MTDFNYPPSTTIRLGSALEQAQRDDDVPDSHRDGLSWAVHGDDTADGFDGWGEDATVTLRGFTTTERNRTLDTARRKSMGPLGSNEIQEWLVAAGLTDAPWIEADDDLHERKEVTGSLPPGLGDWLSAQLGDLNDLDQGN
jgi:hypothetical protein